MRGKIGLLGLVCALAMLVVMPCKASAVIITFEGQSNWIYNAPITRSGFEIGNPLGQEQHFHEITSMEYGLPPNGTGILLNDRDTEIFVQETTGASFSLLSVDVATSLNNYPADGLNIYGYFNDILTGMITIASLGNGWSTVNGASLGTVDLLIFDGIGGNGGFGLDNLNVGAPGPTPAPEPATMLLLGLGLMGLAGIRRKLKK